jgi:hypothetical protein
MANLRDLPQELLVLIYHGLGSIEDVHSFGRTYRKAYGTIQRPPIYLNVMRSIIGQAPQHRYDLQLCKMLDLHKDVVEHMQQHSSQLQTTQPNLLGYVHNEWENRLEIATAPTTCNNKCCTNCLPDETIYSILARYQGLRVLETLWLDRQLTSSDYFSLDESPGADALSLVGLYQVTVHRSELFRDGEMPSRRRQTPETSAYTRLNADQRARFYSAVIYVWLLNEIRWVLTNFAYPVGFDVQILLLESCKEAISAQRRVSLLDELDYIAIFKFMYHHLLPVYSTFLADETIAQLPFTFATDFTKDPGYTSRYVDSHTIRTHKLNPHILTSYPDSSSCFSAQGKPTCSPLISSTSLSVAEHLNDHPTRWSSFPPQQSHGNALHDHSSSPDTWPTISLTTAASVSSGRPPSLTSTS